MTTSAITATLDPAASWTKVLRRFLVALAIVILVAVAFTVGHMTATTRLGPATSPARVQVPAVGADDTGRYCQVGHLRGPC
jgi:hypothetical protein